MPVNAAYKSVAQRLVNAEDNFIQATMEQFGYTQGQAEKILAVYRKHKILKLDAAIGRYQLKHGAFWDRLPMENALKEVL
jgi:hypothetical protein